MFHELRVAVRLLAKDRWLTAVAVFALSLGIGVNATVFTLVNAVLIRGLPFPDSDALFVLQTRQRNGSDARVSYQDLQDWRARTRTLAGIAGFLNTSFTISDDLSSPEQAEGSRITANTFGLLGERPFLGRDFGPDDERPGAPPTVLLGHRIWTVRYGADRGIVGRTIRIGGEPVTVIGVMADGMMFPTAAALWVPYIPVAQEPRDWRGLEAFGRLRPGVTRGEAEADLDQVAAALATAYPATNETFTGVTMQTFNERYNGDEIRTVFLALLGAVGFVLLIACANVASLLLSRSARRAREMAVKMALGATRWRIIRQLLVESVLIGCLGGAVGLLLALMGVRVFDAAVTDVGKPYWVDFRMDFVVFGYLAVVCIATGIIFGLAPALQVSRTSVNDVLSETGRGSVGIRRGRWLSSALVVSEIALTIVLLVGAGLMLRSFLNMYAIDVGFKTDHLMTMRLQLPGSRYPTEESRREFFEALTPKLAAIPGAESVGLTTSLPPSGTGGRRLEIDGEPPVAPAERPSVAVVTVSPSLFETVGVTVLRGRAFSERDGTLGAGTVIVNERFAARFMPDGDPIGRRIRFPTEADPAPEWRTIIGLSPSIRHNSLREAQPVPAVYVPHRQEPPTETMVVIRSQLVPAEVLSAARAAVEAVDRDQPVFSGRTVEESLTRSRWPFRVFGSLFALFAFIALVFSSVGLYAVMAYSVSERRQEIGVRMALGADARRVSWLILRRGLLQLLAGLALGLSGAYFVSTVMASLLVQVQPRDPVTFVAISALLSGVALSACLVAARRATRLDPLVALRTGGRA